MSQARNGRKILSYSYDKNGNVTGVTDQTGKTTEYAYDSINNLKSVKDGNDILAAYTYNSDSTVSNINYKNGIKISYNYNKDKNVTSLVQKDAKAKIINSFDYTYDNNENELSKNENGIETSYTYDKMNRLLTAGTDSFTYDNAGNRATWNRGNEKIKYTYDANNRMTAVTSSNSGSIVYSYDNNGNQLTSSDGTTYTYDGFNQLKSVEQADGSWMENQYDAFGLRISVTENGIGSDFTYDRGNIITETNGSGNLVSRNIRGLGLIARENPIGTKAYYLNNAHGDVSKLVNENGEVLNAYQYDAFGNTTCSKEKVQNRFQYAGEQLDKVTGQYYLRARHYDPATGRFITEDTYRGQLDNTKSLNLYTYCENNPIMYVDPRGHWTWKQKGYLIAGMYERVKDEGLNLLKINPISMLINAVKQWNALINQKITISELYAAGFESIVSDYKYVLDSKNKFVEAYTMFKCGASNKQVHDAGYHAVGILIDLATLAISVGKIVEAVKANRQIIKVTGELKNHYSVVGKNGSLSLEGTPSSTVNLYSKDGILLQRRYYGTDGKALKDIDFSHGGNHTFPHTHIWDWSSGKPSRK